MKVNFAIFEDGWVCFQVAQMDEGFRALSNRDEDIRNFYASNGFCVRSSIGPDFFADGRDLLLVCGYERENDLFVPRKKFGNKEIAIAFVERAKTALRELTDCFEQRNTIILM